MNDKLEQLYNKAYTDESTKNDRKFIQIIETDLSVINTFNNASRNPKLTRIVADYGISLANTGYYKKSIPYLERAIKWLESDKNIKDLWAEPLYEALIFNRGFVNHQLQNRIKANDDFKILTQKYPDNDLYLKWLKSGADYNYGMIEWMFAGIAIISIFFSFVLEREDGIFDQIAFFGIFVGLFGGLIINHIRKRRLKIK